MGKKNNKSQPHASNSFAQLVSKTNQEALKPYIHQIAADMMEDLGGQLGQRLAKQQLAAVGEIITRLAAIEASLIDANLVTKVQLVEKTFDLEDKAWSLTKSSEGAEKGDFVRITYKAKLASESAWNPEDRLHIKRLGSTKDGVSTDGIVPEVSAALLGMKSGEEKEVPFEILNKVKAPDSEELVEQVTKYVVHVKVDRVSKYPVAPKAPEVVPQPEAANE